MAAEDVLEKVVQAVEEFENSLENQAKVRPALGYDLSKTAIVCIEFQNDFCHADGGLNGEVKGSIETHNTIENTVKLTDAAREAGVKIIHAPITFKADYRDARQTGLGIISSCRQNGFFNSEKMGSDYWETMVPKDGDLEVQGKHGLSGFAQTNLELLLKENDIEHVALTGFLTNCCVESTMRDGYELGYNMMTICDCTAATSLPEWQASVNYTYGMFSTPMMKEEFETRVLQNADFTEPESTELNCY